MIINRASVVSAILLFLIVAVAPLSQVYGRSRPGWDTLSKEQQSYLKSAMKGDTAPKYVDPDVVYSAIKIGDAEAVEKMAAAGVDPNRKGDNGMPLSALGRISRNATYYETLERIVAALIKGTIPLDMKLYENYWALRVYFRYAADFENSFDPFLAFQALQKGGIDLVAAKSSDNRTLLFDAQTPEQLDALVALGLPVSTVTTRGDTPLFFQEEWYMIAAFIRVGVDPKVRNKEGKSALDLAKSSQAVYALMKGGAGTVESYTQIWCMSDYEKKRPFWLI